MATSIPVDPAVGSAKTLKLENVRLIDREGVFSPVQSLIQILRLTIEMS